MACCGTLVVGATLTRVVPTHRLSVQLHSTMVTLEGDDGSQRAGSGGNLEQPRSALDAIRKARGANAGAANGAGAGAGAGSQGDVGAGAGSSDARPSSAWGHRPSSRGPRPTSPLQIPPPRIGSDGGGGSGRALDASRARLMEDSVRRMVLEGVDFDSDVDGMVCARVMCRARVACSHPKTDPRMRPPTCAFQSQSELRAKVLQFRQLIQSGLYDRIEEQGAWPSTSTVWGCVPHANVPDVLMDLACCHAVLNDLSEHETAAYIQELESTVKKLQTSLRDEALKHRELRIAFTALQRANEKCVAWPAAHDPQPVVATGWRCYSALALRR